MKHILSILALLFSLSAFANTTDILIVADNDMSRSAEFTDNYISQLDTCKSYESLTKVYAICLKRFKKGNISADDFYKRLMPTYSHRREIIANASSYKSDYTKQLISLSYTFLYDKGATHGASIAYAFFPIEHFGFGPSLNYTRGTSSSPMLPNPSRFTYSSYTNTLIMLGLDLYLPYINSDHCLFGSKASLGYQHVKTYIPGCSPSKSRFYFTYSPLHLAVGKTLRFMAEPYIGTTSDWHLLGGLKAGIAFAF